ncbi:aryl hydrocarbon receptor nuclear translocator like [Homo sapiens]|uniref:Basic helix-loop-helix ARNT like 1 n=1 Tax=Homo sapiens TaxID=9606 RepID=A0A669KAX2_HUMAN|nr:aryl hydrocarbon receptor nuclear translocator like [Homo sapiens]KAI4070166.1 aryl hydrocarbon receptor nuclear translocator like [Homo sapiens]
MADQRMDISSTISDFMSPGPTDLLSSSLGTSGVDCNRKRKGSSTDYQENLRGGIPPTADVLSAEVHRSNLGSTMAGGQMPTRRCYD